MNYSSRLLFVDSGSGALREILAPCRLALVPMDPLQVQIPGVAMQVLVTKLQGAPTRPTSFGPTSSSGQDFSMPPGGTQSQSGLQGDASQQGLFGMTGQAVGSGYQSHPCLSPIHSVFTPGAQFHGQFSQPAPNPQGSMHGPDRRFYQTGM